MSKRKTFAQNLKVAIIREGITNAMLAEWSGVSLYSINDYTSGRTMPRKVNLDKLCKVLRVTRDELLRGGL